MILPKIAMGPRRNSMIITQEPGLVAKHAGSVKLPCNTDQFSQLEIDLSDDSDATLLDYEQVNPQSFKCMKFFRPFFWLLYYLFCCCVFTRCFASE